MLLCVSAQSLSADEAQSAPGEHQWVGERFYPGPDSTMEVLVLHPCQHWLPSCPPHLISVYTGVSSRCDLEIVMEQRVGI